MKPKNRINNVTFYPVPVFGDESIAFGAKQDAYFKRSNLPDVPDEFEDMASSLFFSGGTLPEFSSCIDRSKAARAIKAWLSSWAPAHEEKITTVGYALWLWTSKGE